MSSKFQFLLNPIQTAVRGFFNSCGYEISKSANIPPDDLAIIKQVKPFTGTSNERISGLIEAVKYLSRNQIEGDIVECGVWRGGSTMAAMLALRQLGDTYRDVYLFDTFEGMTPPTEKDVMFDGTKAAEVLARSKKIAGPTYWCIADLDDVKRNVYSTG